MNGVNDSTTLRVIPVFDAINASDENRRAFIQLLNERFGVNLPIEDVVWSKICYGKKTVKHLGEARIKSTVERRVWMLKNIFGKREYESLATKSRNPLTIEKRLALINGDKKVLNEALDALEGRAGRVENWMVFEGNTAPDVLIESANYVLVVEGKQTEFKRTQSTKWGTRRDQMIRHMDALLDGERPVYSLFICSRGTEIKYDLAAYKREDVFRESLVHRSDEQKIRKSMNGVLGSITWEELAERFGVSLS